MTEFIVNRLKGAETRDWMSSRAALKKAILTNDLRTSCRRRCQHHRRLATDCLLPEGDGTQRRWG